MALKTKQDVNNEQWQPLQDDWLRVTGVRVCVRVCARGGGERGSVCVGVHKWESVCVSGRISEVVGRFSMYYLGLYYQVRD